MPQTRQVNLDNKNVKGSSKAQGGFSMCPDTILRDYIQSWLTVFKHDNVKPATYARLECSAKALEDYPIAAMQIDKITCIEIQKYVNELTASGYGLSTIKKQFRIVTAPLRLAAAMHLIPADPSVGVRLPAESKVKKAKTDVQPYTKEEQERIWTEIHRAHHSAAQGVGLMLETGLRVGELLALKWSCIDIPRKRLRVEATILNLADGQRSLYQDSPKSFSSKRTVPLTPTAIDILNRLQDEDDTWVFVGSNGNRLSYEAMRYQTMKLCENAHVPYRGEHVFRHTFATNCYYRNVDVKVLSKLLGHADVNITYNIYISLHDDGFEEMYAALNG